MDAKTADALLAQATRTRERMRVSNDSAVLDEAERQYPLMREAMDWCLEHDRVEEAYRFATALVPFWMATKRIDEGDRWFAKALGEQGSSEAGRARAIYDHGYLVFWAGRYELASQRFTDALARAEALQDHDLAALALAGSARVALNDEPRAAVRLLRRARDVTVGLPDSAGRSSAMHVLGVALQMSGDLAGAREVMRERLDEARGRGNEYVVFIESANLSMVERQLGNLTEAEALSVDALRIAWERRDELAIPWVINGLAAVTTADGRLLRAARLVGIAEALLARAGGEWPPDERQQFDGTLATLSAALTPAALDEERTAGAAMALEDAVAFALSEAG